MQAGNFLCQKAFQQRITAAAKGILFLIGLRQFVWQLRNESIGK
jgi:hypothetical protein